MKPYTPASTTLETHPYADAWPILSDEELAELAEDIATSGLQNPIVIYGDRILDGRNRAAACGRAGVTPAFVEFEGTDDEALAYVESANGARRHQSKGSLAASWAIGRLAAGKRENGRWKYGEAADSNVRKNLNDKDRAQLGVIADHAPDLLVKVRDEDLTLNAAFEQAEKRRDAERDRLEAEERRAAAEADAKAFIEDNAPDLAAQVGDGQPYLTFSEALAIWEQRNREEAQRIAREKAERERRERDERKARSDLYTQIARAVEGCAVYGDHADVEHLMGQYDPSELNPPQLARALRSDSLTKARKFIDALIAWEATS